MSYIGKKVFIAVFESEHFAIDKEILKKATDVIDKELEDIGVSVEYYELDRVQMMKLGD